MAREKPITEEQIARMMKSLDCGRDEAIQVIKDDRAIDRGERLDFEFSEEKEKEILKEAHKGTDKNTKKVTNYQFTKRERKPNEIKRALITELAQFLQSKDNTTIANPEREITFTVNGNEFSLTLIQHRKPK